MITPYPPPLPLSGGEEGHGENTYVGLIKCKSDDTLPYKRNSLTFMLFLDSHPLPPFNKLKDVRMCFNQFYIQIGKIFQFLGFWCRQNL